MHEMQKRQRMSKIVYFIIKYNNNIFSSNQNV